MDKYTSFRSVVTNQGSIEGENGGLMIESVVGEGCNGQFTCEEEDEHVNDIPAEVSVDELSEETIVVKECQSSVDQVNEEVKNSVDSQRLENLEEIALVEEKPEDVLQGEDVEENESREDVLTNDTSGNMNEMPMKVMEKETNQKLTKKDLNRTRNSPKPDQVRTKTNKTATSKKTPPSKEIRNMTKTTKKPAAPISKAPPGFSTPRVHKPASKVTSLSASQSSAKRGNVTCVLRNKQTAPKSLHMSMSLGPSASDPAALTSTRKSLIMERMGDKDFVKRAFKAFQKSYDFKTSVNEPKPAQKQNPAKPTSIPSVATRLKENDRPAKASGMEKRSSTNTHGLKTNVAAEKQQKEGVQLSKSGARPVDKTRLQKNPKAGVIDAKTLRNSLNPKAIPMQGSLSVRTLQKGSSEKV